MPSRLPSRVRHGVSPASGDCTSEIITKVASVAEVASTAATTGVFSSISTASKAEASGIKCGDSLRTAVTRLMTYASDLQSA